MGEAGRAPDTPLTMSPPTRDDADGEPTDSVEPVTGMMAPPSKANGNGKSAAANAKPEAAKSSSGSVADPGVSTDQGKAEGTSPGQVVKQAVAATNNWFTGRTQKASSAPAKPATPAASDTSAAEKAPTPPVTAPAAAKPSAAPAASPSPSVPPAPAPDATRSANGASAATRPAAAFNTIRAATARVAGPAPARATPGSAGPTAATPQRPVDASPWSAAKPPKKKQRRNKRQAHLTVARVEPWSVMKFSFVVSVVAFIVLFVAVAVLYGVLSSLGVFTSLQHLVSTVTSSKGSGGTNINSWFSASRILGYTGLLGSLNIVLITAMATIGSVVYNLIAKVFGGVEITLRETD